MDIGGMGEAQEQGKNKTLAPTYIDLAHYTDYFIILKDKTIAFKALTSFFPDITNI
jgi:hypothetical protein